MLQKIVNELGGVGMFGVVSICLFFVVFSGAMLWALLLKKKFLNSMGSLPLRDADATPNAKGEDSHG